MGLKAIETLYRADARRISRFLQEADIFAGMSKRNLDRIASMCEELRFAPGKRLGGQHEAGSRLCIVQSGAIAVSMGAEV